MQVQFLWVSPFPPPRSCHRACAFAPSLSLALPLFSTHPPSLFSSSPQHQAATLRPASCSAGRTATDARRSPRPPPPCLHRRRPALPRTRLDPPRRRPTLIATRPSDRPPRPIQQTAPGRSATRSSPGAAATRLAARARQGRTLEDEGRADRQRQEEGCWEGPSRGSPSLKRALNTQLRPRDT